jgi:hypothetical protein
MVVHRGGMVVHRGGMVVHRGGMIVHRGGMVVHREGMIVHRGPIFPSVCQQEILGWRLLGVALKVVEGTE